MGGSDILFDYSVANCDGKITYNPDITTFKFKIDEECGVYLAEGAEKVPTVSFKFKLEVSIRNCLYWVIYNDLYLVSSTQIRRIHHASST